MAKTFSAKWNKFYSAFCEALLDCGEQLNKQGEGVMVKACETWMDKLHEDFMAALTPNERYITAPTGRIIHSKYEGDHNHPWFTGSLHDSISARVADGSRTIALRYMPRMSTDAQFAEASEAGRDYPFINGQAFGRLMAGRASRISPTAVSAQLFIGVPYAQYVDSDWRHSDFINEMNTQFISYMEEAFLPKGNANFKNLIVRPRK